MTEQLRLLLTPLIAPTPEELRDAAVLLAEAFEGGALFHWALPEASRRKGFLLRLFELGLRDALRFGRIDAAVANGRLVGVIVWYPPGAWPIPLSRILPDVRGYAGLALTSPSAVLKLAAAQRALDALRPRTPHAHAYLLAGRGDARVAHRLIRRLREAADAEGWPLYLETQEERVTKLYLREGFRMLSAAETPAGGPVTWTMWREAGGA